MSELTVVGFRGKHRAAEVLSQILELKERWAIDLNLKDAVAVYRTDDGRLRVDESLQTTSTEGAMEGGLIGAIIGAMLLAPFTAGVSAAAAAATVGAGVLTGSATGAVMGGTEAAESKAVYGLSEDFVSQAGGMVQPGNSALFILGTSTNPEEAARKFKGYGGEILRTTLPRETARRVQETIATAAAR